MSNDKKITIEKRVFKLANNEDFILEYPSNYKELVDKKLNKLQEEYDEVNNVNNKQNENNENNENININDKENLSDNSKNLNEKNGNINNNNIDDANKEYYHSLGEVPDTLNDDDDGFIEVKEENNGDNKIENNNINLNEYEKLNQNDEKKEININDFEFTEDIKVEDKKKEVQNIKRKNSPIKNPDKIKEAMKSLNIKPPEWAKNLSDEDFMFRVKTYLKNKKK